MSAQIAKLFLRGSLCNITIKHLDEVQRRRIEDVVIDVMTDPILQPARQAFVQALANTIGNEYKDPTFAMEEVTIAVWRATVSALHHKPMPEVIDNPKQRKKFYQEWIFNSLKQILAENKITRVRKNYVASGYSIELAQKMATDFLAEHRINIIDIIKQSPKHITIKAEITCLPLQLLPKLWKINRRFVKHDVQLSCDELDCNCLHIKSDKMPELIEVEMPYSVNVRTISFESREPEDSESVKYAFEYELAEANNDQAQSKKEFYDTINTIKNRLSDDARAVLDVILLLPDAYTQVYGDAIKQSHVAKYLKMSQKRVVAALELIRLHCVSAGLSPDGEVHLSSSTISSNYTICNIQNHDGYIQGDLYRDGKCVAAVKIGEISSFNFINREEESVLDEHVSREKVPQWLVKARKTSYNTGLFFS